jgi:hypothetical protein
MEAEPQLEAGSSDDEGPDGGQWVDAGSRGSPRDDSLVVTWQLHVKSDDGVTTIEIEPDASCVEAKERIARIEGTPAELMRLSLSMPGPGNVPLVELNDMFSLSECGVKDGSVVLLSRKDAASPPPRTATGSDALSEQRLRAFNGAGERPSEAGVAQWLSHEDAGSRTLEPEPEPVGEPGTAGVGGGQRDMWRLLQRGGLLDTLVDGQTIDAALASLGVEEVEDIAVLEPEDFESIGVTVSQQQMLQSLAADFQAGGFDAGSPPAPAPPPLQQSGQDMGASASARLAQLSTPRYRASVGQSSANGSRRQSESGYSSPTSTISSRGAGPRRTSPRSAERTVAVEKFVARQRAWNGMRQRNLEEKKRELMRQEGSLQHTRRLTRAEVAEFADRQMDAVELREIRRELLKEEVVYNEVSRRRCCCCSLVDLDLLRARSSQRQACQAIRPAPSTYLIVRS